MYAIDWSSLFTRTRTQTAAQTGAQPMALAPARARGLPAVSGTVWALGFTSLFTDISSEMIASILPMYLVVQLGMQPAAFGIIDGLYQGSAALVRVAAGMVADRWQRYKEVAAIGYGLSALCRVALLAVGGTWGAIAGIVAVDRLGKGIRTAPRDALISLRSPAADLATAFGVHRGLDAAGAMLGPLLAFLLLAWMPGRFDVLFSFSFVVAVIGVVIILLFVPPVAGHETRSATNDVRRVPVIEILRTPGFPSILSAAFLLGLPTVSDGFIFLTLQRQLGTGASAFPLFFVATALFTACFSVPCGRAADRMGRRTVLLAGYGMLAVAYLLLLVPGAGLPGGLAALALLGAYYAATDGVLTAMAAALLPPAASGSGLSFLATAVNVARVLASVLFGLVWARAGITAALWAYFAVLVAAISASALLLGRSARVRS